MSWLFDRICELAVADCIDIVIAADTGEPAHVDGAFDLAEVLVRASHIPQLTVTVLPNVNRGAIGAAPPAEEVDLDLLPDRDAVIQVRHLLDVHHALDGAPLLLRGGVASIQPVGSAVHTRPAPGCESDSSRAAACRCVFATDRPDDAARFGLLAEHDLGIAIGGAHPLAQVNVDDILGLVSIIDALITLRYVAFGVGSVHS